MTAANFLAMLVGGLLVYVGVLAGALADRIRNGLGTPAPARRRRAVELELDEREPARRPSRKRSEIATPAASPDVTPVPVLNEVRDALVQLGYSPSIAREAAAEARRKIGDGAPLPIWIREALRCCPKPLAVVA